MKRIAVGFITYPINWYRVDYLTRAIVAAKQCIEASQDELVWFCSSEVFGLYGDSEEAKHVWDLCERYDIRRDWNNGPPSMGANENNAMRIAFDKLGCDYLLLHIDDCYAIRKVDLSQAVSFMEVNQDVDILRYHYSPRKECIPKMTPRNGGVFQIDPASKWFYDDSPHVRRANYIAKFGEHKEGTPEDSGPTEVATNATLRAKGASICTYPSEYFEKHGPVSASR